MDKQKSGFESFVRNKSALVPLTGQISNELVEDARVLAELYDILTNPPQKQEPSI